MAYRVDVRIPTTYSFAIEAASATAALDLAWQASRLLDPATLAGRPGVTLLDVEHERSLTEIVGYDADGTPIEEED